MVATNGRKKVLVYARYSKDEQNPRSTDDQIAYCRRWLQQNGYADAEVVEATDEGISGEIISRPGIDKVREVIKSGEFAILISEDVSRFWRDRNEPGKFAGLCADHNTRLVTVNDHVDTARPTWEEDIARAAGHHASANRDTSERIKRASEGRWENGEAMGPLVPGYKRIPMDPVRYERTRRGPFRDEKDEQWAATIEKVFQRCARGDSADLLADFLNKSNFPLFGNSLLKRWTDRGAKNLIKNPIYAGRERFRATFAKKHFASGCHRPERSAPDKVWSRQMPHLRFVSDLLWQQANDAITKRDRAGSHPMGIDNPTYRVPRNSRTPLANYFFCEICGSKMLAQGRGKGGYRCGNAIQGRCWNRATCFQSLAHERILAAVCQRLLKLDGAVDALEVFARDMHGKDGEIGRKVQELQKYVAQLGQKAELCARKCLEYSDSEAYEKLRKETEDALRAARADLQALQAQTNEARSPLTREEILASIDTTIKTLDGPEAWQLIRSLTTPIQAVPFQRIDCGLVVLRARFKINLIAVLPDQWKPLARRAVIDLASNPLLSEQIEVDLFDNPGAVKLAAQALSLSRQDPPLTGEQIAARLGANRWTAYGAIHLGKLMEQRGMAEPYIELREPPANASRWRRRTQQAPKDPK